ncbi:hypothetical protein V1478_015456 [Vespula squamosa]|uniref:Uncharacterized protein n=1 Tax=Vespula squamosa TaxID=30214 RepID=A0ABD2A545_VESSQ
MIGYVQGKKVWKEFVFHINKRDSRGITRDTPRLPTNPQREARAISRRKKHRSPAWTSTKGHGPIQLRVATKLGVARNKPVKSVASFSGKVPRTKRTRADLVQHVLDDVDDRLRSAAKTDIPNGSVTCFWTRMQRW